MARKSVRGYQRLRVTSSRLSRMIGLSVAVGRFVEALFWAILRVAGMVGGVVLLGVVGMILLWWLIRRRR
ncbi:hypothetical protein [Sphingomonas sp. Leaf21]|uniref:hypothetical protein n=1 Tax=Sphingomonas sp. Leaf21 TaxID=2876550 RepID=UPI001E34CB59|nr:hypothetical protein [Sphingomonas sp. Leaf21]